MGSPRKLHAWGRNETTRTPAVVLALATIPGQRPPDHDGCQPEFRWAVVKRTRGYLPGEASRTEHHAGSSRKQLAIIIDDLCRLRVRTWLYAHGLAVHLSSAGLLDQLTVLGWVPVKNSLDGPAPSVEFGHSPTVHPGHSRSKTALDWHKRVGITVKDCRAHPEINCPYRTDVTEYERHLVIADAGAVWPRTTTADLIRDTGQQLAPQPGTDDDRGWADVAMVEATALAEALTIAMDWWQVNDCGNWGKTGATTGWNAMRHRMSREATFVDVTHPATALERAACHGGRRGLFRFGSAPPGTYEELDFYRAYTVVARDMLLPTGRRAAFESLPLDHITITEERGSVGLIAQVVISRGGGRYPMADGNRVWYPEGRFQTILAGPEIREANRLGVLESVGRGQWYTMGHTMAPWAAWCLQEQENAGTPAVVVRMLKHHGRAVIGKTAAHAYAHDDLGPAHTLGFRAEPTVVGPDRKTGWVIDLGGRRILTYQDGEADESFPAILAYVESHVRVMLSRVIDTIGTRAAIQCDTDGLIVSLDTLRNAELPGLPDVASPGMPFRPTQVLEELGELVKPLTVREKTIQRSFHGTGPQHYQLGTTRKRSGIPGNARPDGKGNLVGITYPSLMEQASRGAAGAYVPQTWIGKDPPCVAGRWVLTNSRTIAPEACLTATGETVLLPWELTAAYYAGLELGPTQDPVLVATARDPGPGYQATPWTVDDLDQIRAEYL